MGKDLATRVADKASSAPATQGGGAPKTIYQLIEEMKGEIARALPRHMNPDRIARIAVTTIRQNPKLLQCESASLLGALMLSAQLGLEPGPLGHCYFVPFKNGRRSREEHRDVYEVQWMLGYKGIIDLARRSGNISTIFARDVCEHDLFEFEYGLDERLVHKPKMDGDRGALIAVYGVARFTDGGHFMLVMSKADVEKHRGRSKSKDDGPWVTDYDAMARKTVIRAMQAFLPMSPELAGALSHDETVRGGTVNPDLVLDVPPPQPVVLDVAPEPTGELQQGDGGDGGGEPQSDAEPTDAAPATAEAPADAPQPAQAADGEDACPACGEVPSHSPQDCPMAGDIAASINAEQQQQD
jgi:recombination protein RecT